MSSTFISRSAIDQMEKNYRRNFINTLSGFKNANLVGTINSDGETNLAIFTQTIHLGASPPLMGLLIRPHTVPRHSLENILETRVFTINHVHKDFFEKAHHTSARWQKSEFEACGLTPQFSENLIAPYVQESAIKIGLTFKERIDIALNGTILIIGEIMEIITPKSCIQPDGFIDIEKCGTVACAGLDSYHSTQKIARLAYAKPGIVPKKIDR